jgi:DNA-binding beta-propeller fold protein YncE
MSYSRIKSIDLPGSPLLKFDISWIDPEKRRYYFADRSNARIVVIDSEKGEFLRSIGEGDFSGATANGKVAGPNGVLLISARGELWSGDGDSTTKVHDAESGRLLQSISTGGTRRCDELAHDEVNGVVLVANDAEPVPFVSLISVDGDREVRARIEFPRATNGLHQPVWDRTGGLLYISVSELDGDPASGEVAVIDGATGKVVGSLPVDRCQPAGMVLGPGRQLCVACGKDAVDKGFPPATVVIDLDTREVVRFEEVGGTDQVWYNPGDDRYYLAARGMTGGSVLGVIDAGTLGWVENIPTSPDSHSVAADPLNNHVFIPASPTEGRPNGRVDVFARIAG